ncbi:MAG: helix-turn-helix transcriptional regulator [Burkholderiales bacterium]|nr:helix-turn-helix transcriptional regulator [Burkholderiales bacterium]
MRDRVEERVKALGLNPFDLAVRHGLNRHFIHDILNGKKLSVQARNMRKLAEALRCSPDYLTGKADTPGAPALPPPPLPAYPPSKFVTVIGECEAGTFRNLRIMAARPKRTIPVALDPRLPASDQGAFLVLDGSLEASGVMRGMFLICATPAAYERSIGPVSGGGVVVVQRTRTTGEVEVTAREIVPGPALAPNPIDPSSASMPLPAPEGMPDGEDVIRVIGVALSAARLF